MRIAQIVSTFPPYQGGMGNVAAAMQDELIKQGHDCDVLTPWYKKRGEGAEGQKHVHRIRPHLRFGNAAFVPSIKSLLRSYDVLHLHYPFFGGAETVAWHKARHPSQRLVITYHMDTLGTGWKAPVFATYRAGLMPWIMSKADAITVSTMDYAKHSALAPFLDRWPVHELPFGVSEQFAPVERNGLQTDGQLQLLFVGALDYAHYFKGLPRLLEAMRVVLAHDVPVRLVVIGDGDMRIAYEAEVGRLGLHEQVVFRGRVDTKTLVKSYQEADTVVLPSVDQSESFGLVLIESMACGTPVLASDLPGVRSVLKPGETGWLCKPGSAKDLAKVIESLWQERDSLAKMRQASAERVNAMFRWPGITKQLLNLYKP